MGIEGLWGLIQNLSFKQTLKNFNTEYRFMKNADNAHAPVVGVDASVFLDTFHAANKSMQTRTQNLHTSDTTLTQFYHFLCQLSEAGLHCIFCFDGSERPPYKWNRKVIHRKSSHYKHAETLIKLFGFHAFTAKGDADAELANLNRKGAINAVLTKDSDIFPFGATCILRLVVEVYDTTTIQERTGISQGGFILMALLLQNDISKGISGIGARTAYGLAQCGFGDSILDAAFQYPAATIPTAFKEINNQMATEIKLNSHGKIGSCSPARSHKLRTSEFPSLQDLTEIKAFARPPTLSDIPTYLPKLPDIEGIASFCREYFAWSSELTFKKFHASLWPAVIVQMLCSVSILTHIFPEMYVLM
ncbi:PIN domain-like protein [Lentinula raphanica]|nr:PIN domain-like protein [Lentinula raphanica]